MLLTMQVVLCCCSLCRRYLALCFGEVRIRVDLQKAPGLQPQVPDVPEQSNVKQGQVLSLGPSLLLVLSQVRQRTWGSWDF